MRPRDLLLLAAVALGLAALLVVILSPSGAERRPAAPPGVPGGPGADASLATPEPRAPDAAAEEAAALGEERAALPSQAEAAPTADAFEADALYGRVVDAEERTGVAEAEVLVFPGFGRIETGGPPLAATTSDEHGRFRLRGLGASELYHVHVRAEGRLPFTRRVLTGVDHELELERACPIRGVVLGERTEAPVAGLDVRVVALHFERAPGSTGGAGDTWSLTETSTTDAEGRFALRWGRSGVVDLRVGGPGRVDSVHQVSVLAGDDTPFELLVPEGEAVRAELSLFPEEQPLGELDFELDGRPYRTDGAGGFELALAPSVAGGERLDLHLSAPGYLGTRVRANLAQLEPPLRFHLARGARVEGTVTDAEGRPLAGARVWVSGGGAATLSEKPGRGESFEETTATETDAAGHFVLAGLVPREGPVTLAAGAPGRSRASTEVALPATGSSAWASLVLARGATLEGRLFVDGVPGRGRVLWRGEGGEGRVETNDHGDYRLEGVTPGQLELWGVPEARLRRDWSELALTVFAADGETTTQDLHIETGALATRGRVLDEDGTPLADVRIYARAGREEEHQGARTDSELDGTFELPLAPFPGGYRLVARDGPRLGVLDGVVAGMEGLELVLPALGRVGLDVRDAVTDAPIPDFELYWRDDTGVPFRRYARIGGAAAPDAEGIVWFTLPRGVVDLAVTARRQGYPTVELPRTRVLAESDARVETVRLARGGTLILLFQREKAKKPSQPRGGLRGLYVVTDDQFARRVGGGDWYEREVRRGQAVRPRRGRAVLRNLAAGTYTFKRRPAGVRLAPTTFEVVAGEERRVVVRWRATGAAAGPTTGEGEGGGGQGTKRVRRRDEDRRDR